MRRNIVTCILLTFITCGFYALFWMYTINDEAIRRNPQEWNTGFGMVFLLSIVTCGIYG